MQGQMCVKGGLCKLKLDFEYRYLKYGNRSLKGNISCR
jgi:hypothetical protein